MPAARERDLVDHLPKAELHLHLEGTLAPDRVMSLAKRYSISLTQNELASRYHTRNFAQFLELYKWATSFLREPEDYAQLAEDAATALHKQNVVYSEITLSIGIMLLRKQNVVKNFRAICEVFQRHAAAGSQSRNGLQVQFIFDAVRQFGAAPAMEVVRIASEFLNEGVVAFGLGGDELALPVSDFREVFAHARNRGLHLVCHAGETGGPEQIQDAIDILGAERIGHGLAAIRSPALMDFLAERKIPLEVCPTSNLRTNALNIQLNSTNSALLQHPLPKFVRHRIPVSISTDDPAMFHATLNEEYAAALQMGLSLNDLLAINRAAFEQAFLSDSLRRSLLSRLPAQASIP